MMSTGFAWLILSLALLAAVVAVVSAAKAREEALSVRLLRHKVDEVAAELASLTAQHQKLSGRFYRLKAKDVPPDPAEHETPEQTRARLGALHPGVRGQLSNPATYQ